MRRLSGGISGRPSDDAGKRRPDPVPVLERMHRPAVHPGQLDLEAPDPSVDRPVVRIRIRALALLDQVDELVDNVTEFILAQSRRSLSPQRPAEGCSAGPTA